MRTCLLVVLWCLPPLALADDLDAFFEAFKAKRENVSSVQARFVETTTLPDETYTAAGAITFAKPRRMVRVTESPQATMVVDETTVYEYEPEIKQLDIYSIEDGPDAEILFFGFDENLEKLKASYEVSLFDPKEDDPRGGKGLLIEPQQIHLEDAAFLEVALYLREDDYLPYKLRIVTDQDSHVILEISDIKVNASLPESAKTFEVAAGTKVIHNNKVVTTLENAVTAPPVPGVEVKPEAGEKAGPSEAAPKIEVAPLQAPETKRE